MNIGGYPSSSPVWSAKLCGCGGDAKTCNNHYKLYIYLCMIKCLITCCLPCVTFGQIAEIVDEGKSSCASQGCVYGLLMIVSCHWIYSCVYREKLRKKYGLESEPCCDCCVHFCCDPCALCQEHQELKLRGHDPSKGWIGPPTTNQPPMPPTMYK
ncbi:hypothetical protein AHAS_Ahas19G0230800 [Arachis hypogaea]